MRTSPHEVVLITGGAGGVGSATAEILAADGYSVALMDSAEQQLARSTRTLRDAGADVLPLPVDVADSTAVASVMEQIGYYGRLAGVVHAAGVFDVGTITDIDETAWDKLVDIKLKAAFLLCRSALPLIADAGGGSIVLVASMAGRTKSMFTAPSYAAASGGIIGLTMTLAAQSAAQHVRVNAVAPGLINTPMSEHYRNALGADVGEVLPSTIPLGRLGEASEVAEVITFLLSDRAGYITGETINVSGGLFMV